MPRQVEVSSTSLKVPSTLKVEAGLLLRFSPLFRKLDCQVRRDETRITRIELIRVALNGVRRPDLPSALLFKLSTRWLHSIRRFTGRPALLDLLKKM
jgi:hypothetical protein